MIAMLMGSLPVPIALPDCGASDFELGIAVGFAAATFLWIALHYLTRK